MSSENSDALIAQAAISPPSNVGTFSSPKSNIGWALRSSITTNAASRITERRSEPSTVVEPQPSGWERISP